MVKDRAKDPRRVPSLGISDPISHVKVVPNKAERKLEHTAKMEGKYGSDLEDYRAAQAEHERESREN